MAGGRTRVQGDEVTAEELFWRLAAELQAEDSRIAEGTIMNGRCLRVGKEFLALVDTARLRRGPRMLRFTGVWVAKSTSLPRPPGRCVWPWFRAIRNSGSGML